MEEINANKVSDLMIRTPVFCGFPESAKRRSCCFIVQIKMIYALIILHRRNSTICRGELLLIFFDFR